MEITSCGADGECSHGLGEVFDFGVPLLSRVGRSGADGSASSVALSTSPDQYALANVCWELCEFLRETPPANGRRFSQRVPARRSIRSGKERFPEFWLAADGACGTLRAPLAVCLKRGINPTCFRSVADAGREAEGPLIRAALLPTVLAGRASSKPSRSTRGQRPVGHRRHTSGPPATTRHSCRVGSTY